ncbi:uncharacterized protein EAF02_011906 [Botrytis sinoallii]|uniref:uncharacterized protein n=1 Tax=Botrytis sinoallii TaxID=1463999 RepID=UPI0019019456|nr:uncharacterized protein EAF02_011906 [Botrytis sinoallii]KAF7853601.1 hypothetical protein EAF02_011906 [Botrytis sinoallii]
MSIYNDPPSSYDVDEYVWYFEKCDSKDWELAPISTTRQLSIWEQNNALVFNLPELSVYIVDRSALTSNHTRITLAPLHPKNKDEIYLGNSKTNVLMRSLKQGFKSGFKRGAEHGFKTDFMTTFKNNLKRTKETGSVDHHYLTCYSIDFLNVWEERLRGEIMEAWVLDGMDPSPVDRISRTKFLVAKYMIKMRVIKGASCSDKP